MRVYVCQYIDMSIRKHNTADCMRGRSCYLKILLIIIDTF